MMKPVPRILALCAIMAAAPASATVVYSQDFEGAAVFPDGWSGAGAIQTTGGLSAFGFGRQHLRNDTAAATVLTLGALAPHSQVTVTFDLAMWDSIDFGDTFQVALDGVFQINGPFGNYFGPGPCPSGCMDGPGVPLTPGPIDFNNPQYGYSGFRDSARRVTFTAPHAAGALQLAFAYPNTQGGLDESFGLDNILIETDAVPPPPVVPEPASLALLGLGLAGLGIARRRRA